MIVAYNRYYGAFEPTVCILCGGWACPLPLEEGKKGTTQPKDRCREIGWCTLYGYFLFTPKVYFWTFKNYTKKF